MVVLCCLCAVLSKEQGITIVAVGVIYEFSLIRKVTCLYKLVRIVMFTGCSNFQMSVVSGLKLLRTAVMERHHLPSWFNGFMVRVGILATFSISFLVLRVQLMQGGPNIFDRYTIVMYFLRVYSLSTLVKDQHSY